MILSMMTVAVPVYAAPVASTALTVSADKTTASPGDTITYTITMGAVSDLGSIQMVLDIPAGLTYVSGSGALAPGLKAKLGFDDISFTENAATGRCIINGAASAADYASTADTVIATFRCTVNADATGVQELGLTELEFVSCQTFEEITSNFSVVKAAVTVSGATPPVTAFTVSFAANGGTGTMADVTDVPAGAYTLPACKFMPPDSKRFIGWATTASGTATTASGTATAAGGTITVSDNVTLYAIWEEIPTTHPEKPAVSVTGTYTYSGSRQTVTVAGFDSATMQISGNTGTNAGKYTASITSKSGRWADGTSAPVTVEWTIQRKAITPTIRVSGTYIYTGTPVIPTFTVEDGGKVLSSAEYSRSITDNDAIGTGRITVSDKAGGNYEIATTSQTFDIGAPTPPPTVYTSTQLKVTADKTTAAAGDVITFTITMGPVSDLGSIQMRLKLPAGLTVVPGSCVLDAGLQATLGFDDISFAEPAGGDPVITGIASATDYRSDTDTVIATFRCKVKAGVAGELKAELTDLEFFSVDFTERTERFSVLPATVTVAATPFTEALVPVTDLTGKVYTGAVQEPAFGGALVRGTDYDVTYTLRAAGIGSLDGGKPLGAGVYTVTVAGKGGYSGSFTKELTIGKADPAYTLPAGITGDKGKALSTSTALPTGWSWMDGTEIMGVEGAHAFKARFTPSDTANYNTIENIDVTVTVAEHVHTDANHDHICDVCHAVISSCADADHNHTCDVCGKTLSECADDNKDHKCDLCGKTLSECADENKDHKCDLCGKTLSECADENKDHKCDLCGKTLSECADNNKDHKCDLCGKTLSECADENKDHKCDLCGKTLSECADNNKDHKCDQCGKTLSECADDNKDHKCDLCGKTLSECADDNKDHKCDLCGKTLSECADENKDHKCDLCGKTLSECADENKDHKCDLCGKTLSECADSNKDHKCDLCGKTLSECADNNKDHKCDLCGKTLSECADDNKDHKCDLCGKTLSECADDNKDHKCDLCGKTLSECADNNKDHKCDQCGKTLSECADENKDHKCDLCGKTLSECADDNKDHKCDLCGKTLSECADENKDHKCDLCGKTLSECADENKDHKCDLCGKTLSECADNNKDHKCDLCGKTLSECADNNKDHKCDLCGKTLSECADNNKDHKCDLCGKTLSECADNNKDHKCDLCGKTLSECADNNKDHKCDLCGKTLSECADNNKDHKCDLCGKTLSECADENKDHKCDLCGKTLSECADENKDHKCDLCGKTLSECADENKDHKCDLCGKTLSECADNNKDHKCDLCGKTLSECADDNKDHKCDLCGKTLSECADENKDHKCDLCGKTLSECADDNEDHKCDLCGKTLSECADNNKDHKCDVCGKQLTDHTGGTATCKEKAVCTVCGQAYGELTAHTYKTEWTKDGEQHWHECAVCKDRRDGTAHTFEWKTDREATVTEEGAKHEECTVCGYQKPAVTVDKLAPTITEGENSRWNKGSENGLTFRSNAAYADFVEVLVDGNVISSDNYDKREGSIIIELKAGYLGTLSEGEHTITIRSGSGDATISFHVGAQIASPSTGTACVWAWIILGIIALGAGAMAVVLVTRKRNAT